jgi:endonuclease YncB( thermonuclease family)
MVVSKVLVALLVVAGVIGAGAVAYDVARPRVHPIKQADFEKYAALAPDPVAPVSPPRTRLFGEARAIDGDTLLIQDVEANLWTIDAPELAQTCEDRDGKSWACGDASRAHLEQLIGGRQVACRPEGPPPQDGRWAGLCFVADTPCHGAAGKGDTSQDDTGPCASDLTSLNLAQVTKGWATDIEGQYADNEEDARDRKIGIWAGRFDPPSDWRKRAAEQGS